MNTIHSLESNYTDFYDHLFSNDKQQATFKRYAKNKPNRQETLHFLEYQLHEHVLPHGSVSTVCLQFWPLTTAGLTSILTIQENTALAVTMSDTGKIEIMKAGDALFSFPDNYCTLSTPDLVRRTPIIRYVQVGSRAFFCHIHTDRDPAFQRNRVYEDRHLYPYAARMPLFSVDFLPHVGLQYGIAVDFSASPTIIGTGIENLISPQAVHSEITTSLKIIRNLKQLESLALYRLQAAMFVKTSLTSH